MAKLISILFLTLITFTVSTARAGEESFSLSINDLVKADDKEKTDFWTEARCFDLGLVGGYQFRVAGTDNLSKGGVMPMMLDGKFLWSYGTGVGFIGPNLRIGGHYAHGTDAATGESLSDGSFVLQPGVYNSNYLGNRWLLTESISLPLVQMEPGIQFDLGISYIPADIFRIELGVSVSYLQTNIQTVSDEANFLSVGPYLGLIFEPWGEYL